MRQLLLLLATFSPLLQAAPTGTDQPYTYKGFVLGATTFQEWSSKLSAKQAKQISKSECFKPQNGIRECNVPGGVAGVFGIFAFVDDHLATIESVVVGGSDELRGYVDALTEKFGTPTITTEAFQNGFGARRTGHVWTWQNTASKIVLEEINPSSFGSAIGTFSGLRFDDLNLSAEILKRKEKKPVL